MEVDSEARPTEKGEDDEFVDADDLEEVKFAEDEAPSDGSDIEDKDDAMAEAERYGSKPMANEEVTDVDMTSVGSAKGAKGGGQVEHGRISFTGHTDSVYCVDMAVVERGMVSRNVAVSGGGDDRAFVWDVQSGERLAELTEHSDTVVAVAFNFDLTLFATASYDSTVCIYPSSNFKVVQTLQGPSSEIEWLAWHPKGNAIVAGSADSTAWIWDAMNGTCLGVLAGHEDAVTCGCFTRNGVRVITGSADGSVKLWDAKTSACLCTFSGHGWQSGGITTIKLHGSEPLVAAGGQDGVVRLVRLDTQKTIMRLNHVVHHRAEEELQGCSIEALSFCQDTRSTNLIAIGGTDGIISVWDWVQQNRRHNLKHDDVVIKIQFVHNSFLLVSCSSDHTTRLWDARSGQGLMVLSKHEDMVLDFALSSTVGNTKILLTSVGDDKRCLSNEFALAQGTT